MDLLKSIRKHILFQFILIVSLIVLVVGGAVDFLFIYQNSATANQALEMRMKNLLQTQAITLAYPVWNIDAQQVNSVLTAFLLDRDIIGCVVFDGGREFVSTRKTAEGLIEFEKGPPGPNEINGMNGDVINMSTSIMFRNEVLGAVELYYTTRFVKADLIRTNMVISLGGVLLVVLIIIGISIAIRFTLLDPILKIASFVQNVAETRDYTVRLPTLKEDELGSLVNNFNVLMTTINDAESEIVSTKSLLSSVIESMPSIVIALNDSGLVMLWNRAAENASGITKDDIIGKYFDIENPFLSILSNYRDLFRADPQVYHFYKRKFFKDDEKIRDISLYPLEINPLEGKENKGLVMRIDDVSELTKKERQLEQTQKMETIGTLAGGLAHDFNNVLSGVLGSASLMRFHYESNNDAKLSEVEDLLRAIEISGERASRIVQQLLTLSRKTEPSFAALDLNDVIDQVFKILANTIDKSVNLEFIPLKEKIVINGDIVQLEQVFLNLCVNACHAMTIMRAKDQSPGGTLKVEISTFNLDDEMRKKYPDAGYALYWRIRVIDNGTGISQKDMSKLFDPFFTTKPRGQGTGLGLAIVNSIIRQHSGFLDISSSFGIGTDVSVFLPVSHEILSIQTALATPDKLPMGSGTILVIDDEPIVRSTAQSILNLCGYSVLLASSGDEGLELFSRFHREIRLIVLDMVMPGKSGKDTFIALKQFDPDLKVIVSSGFRKDARVDDLMNTGAKAFLEKPYSVEDLAKIVERVLKEA